MHTEFKQKVFACCLKIPAGKVSTYKEVAIAINSPSSARAVGNALNKNPYLVKVPCHRVICSNGFVGGYAKGVRKKINLLEYEGVIVLVNKKVDLSKYFWSLSSAKKV